MKDTTSTKISPPTLADTLTLDQKGLAAARKSLDDGAVTPAYGPHRDAIVKLLNDSPAAELVRVNLIAERVAIERFHQMIQLIGEKDTTTRRMLEAILAQEEEHADELSDWMKD